VAEQNGHKVSTGWPSWRYGPGGKSMICQSEAEVPIGWADNPDKLRRAEKTSVLIEKKPMKLGGDAPAA
jgi:hypothetical protein